jgi:hypothetical protein
MLGRYFGVEATTAGMTIAQAARRWVRHQALPLQPVPVQPQRRELKWTCWECTYEVTEILVGPYQQIGHAVPCPRATEGA